jgi:hypothetical protein
MLTRDEIIARLWDQNPRVAVLPFEGDAVALNPHFLSDGDAQRVVSGILRVVSDKA